MKIFLDTSDIEEIKKGMSYGIVDGVTTNPSLLKKAQEKYKITDMAKYITELVKVVGPGKDVSLEVIGGSAEEMIQQGLTLYRKFNPVAKNVVIKIPLNPATKEEPDFSGLRAIQELTKQGIGINTTLIFTPEQAWLAAKAGAKYVSPFAGRIDDLLRTRAGMKFGKDDYYPEEGLEKDEELLEDNGIVSGVDLVEQIVALFKNYSIKSQVLAASLRNARQVREVALAGADVATLPFSVMGKLLVHCKTTEGMNAFLADTVPEYRDVFE